MESYTLLPDEQRPDGPPAGETFKWIHAELQRLAGLLILQERPNHTLQPSALVNEMYLHLTARSPASWESKPHLYATAAHLMRQILINHPRKHHA